MVSSVVWRSLILAVVISSVLMLIGGYGKALLGRLRKKARAIRLPIHVTENLNKLKKAQRELSQLNGELPNVFQLSEYLGLDS